MWSVHDVNGLGWNLWCSEAPSDHTLFCIQLTILRKPQIRLTQRNQCLCDNNKRFLACLYRMLHLFTNKRTDT